jgi:hypothetical protein
MSLGLTKTQAHSMNNRGYKHHALLPINMARPALLDTDYIATPIRDEGVMLYSFAIGSDFVEFTDRYGARKLDD